MEPQSPYRLLKNIPCKNRPSTFYLSTELLCAYKTSQNFLFHFTQGFHFSPCTELRLLHEQYKDICPIIYKTQQNTKLIIIHRASPPREHSAYLHHTQYTELMLSSGMLPPTKPHTPSKALCFYKKSPCSTELTPISVHRAAAPT